MRKKDPDIVTATRAGDWKKIQTLINNGALVDEKGEYGLTALMWAARTNQIKCMQVLLDNKANVYLRSDSGYTALTCAASNNKHACIEILLKRGAAVYDKNNGRTALHLAAEQADFKCMKILIDNGADVKERDEQGQVALHHVANHWIKDNRFRCAKLLLQHGAKVNTRGRNRETPLHLSTYWGNLDLSKLFIEQGVNVCLINKYGQTAFDIADDVIKTELHRYALTRGIDIQRKNRTHMAPEVGNTVEVCNWIAEQSDEKKQQHELSAKTNDTKQAKDEIFKQTDTLAESNELSEENHGDTARNTSVLNKSNTQAPYNKLSDKMDEMSQDIKEMKTKMFVLEKFIGQAVYDIRKGCDKLCAEVVTMSYQLGELNRENNSISIKEKTNVQTVQIDIDMPRQVVGTQVLCTAKQDMSLALHNTNANN